MKLLPRILSALPFVFLIAPTANAAEQPALLGAGQLIEFALALAAVVAFIYLLAWILKRMQANVQGQGNLRVIQGLQVGNKEKLLLVQIQDQVLLVGVSAGGLQTLHVLDGPLVDETGVVEVRS